MLHDDWSGVCGDESINTEEWIKKERRNKIRKLVQENEAEAKKRMKKQYDKNVKFEVGTLVLVRSP